MFLSPPLIGSGELFVFIFRWKRFDNTWLLESAKDKFPDDYELHNSIRECRKVMNGCYFVNPKNPNKPNSEWQFERSIILENTIEGDIVLDILKDGRVGSIEYLDSELRK